MQEDPRKPAATLVAVGGGDDDTLRRVVVESAVEGGAPPTRSLVVRFNELVGQLLGLGEPDAAAAQRLFAGVDLLRALDTESDVFGRAVAPGTEVGDETEYADRVAALTDESFRAAHELLDVHEETWPPQGPPPLDGHAALVHAVAELMDADHFECVAQALLSCPSTPERALGEEFV